MPLAELKKNYWFVRVRNPKLFSSYGTQDPGRKYHTLRVAGKLKRSGKWATQSWRFHKRDVVIKRGRLVGKTSSVSKILKSLPVKVIKVKSYVRR